jgi:hypothetical protein
MSDRTTPTRGHRTNVQKAAAIVGVTRRMKSKSGHASLSQAVGL